MPKKLTLQLYVVFLAILVIPLIGLTWYSVRTFNRIYTVRAIDDLQMRAVLVMREVERLKPFSASDGRVDSLCKSIGHAVGTRITVILPGGKVIGDSDKDPRAMENHSARPEVISAFEGRPDVRTRFSTTLDQKMVYVALPLMRQMTVDAVLRLAVSLESIRAVERGYYLQLASGGLLILLLLAVVTFYMSRRISRPVQEMKSGALRFAAGDLRFKVAVPAGSEMGALAQALNNMAAQLDERIGTITRQRTEQEAILASMIEGVVAVDKQERIISLNPAAARLFGVNGAEVQGKWIHEVVRNSDLQRFLSDTITGTGVTERDFPIPTPDGERHVQAHGTALKDGSGALIVLADTTALRRLENIRKEFVANVSHELRTPLTSIKGFVETIQNGGYGLPDDVVHFLGIIATKTERLCSIVDDLLTLSSIERDHERREVGFSKGNLLRVLGEAIDSCRAKADGRHIVFDLMCDPAIELEMNPLLLEQAMVNLIDNAVKYSDPGRVVTIKAATAADTVSVSIADQGIGIPKEHLDRLFERFYRVDKARSRKLGGTGLGLSIVKNIVTAHNGRVSVESTPGKGSVFTVCLPRSMETKRTEKA